MATFEGIFNLLGEKHEGGFWGSENVLYLDLGGSYILGWPKNSFGFFHRMYSFVKVHYVVHSRFVQSIICTLYLILKA